MEQSLRRLSVRMENSGTATLTENTKLYKGGYRFVGLRAFIPVTANRAADTSPVCTVHAVIIDQFGVRRQVDNKYYILFLAGTSQIDGFDYLVFERNMPKTFTDTVGDLDLIYNYSEITKDGKLFARLPTNIIHKVVEEGGEADGEIDVDLDLEAVAQLEKNTLDILGLQQDYIELRAASDWIFQPIDSSQANNVGSARVEIVDGNLAFVDIKGEQGEQGIAPHIGFNGNWWIGSNDTGKKAQGPAGESVPAGMKAIVISPEIWSYNSETGLYLLTITPQEHERGATPHLVISAKAIDENGDYIQVNNSFSISDDGVVTALSKMPWSGLIHVMGGAATSIGGGTGGGTMVTVNGIVQATWNADLKADKTYVDELIGNINSILDEINREVV